MQHCSSSEHVAQSAKSMYVVVTCKLQPRHWRVFGRPLGRCSEEQCAEQYLGGTLALSFATCFALIASSGGGGVASIIQPQLVMQSSSGFGRARSAFMGNQRRMSSAWSSGEVSEAPILQRQRCQKAITTVVQMGSAAQHSFTSCSTLALLLGSVKPFPCLSTALAAVVQLQLASCCRISFSTTLLRSLLICTRSAFGACQSSSASPLSTILSVHTSPMSSKSFPGSWATWMRKRPSWRPSRSRVLSTARIFQISVAPLGQTRRNFWASSEFHGTRSASPTASMTWPRSPPAVPTSRSACRPPASMAWPLTRSTSPGWTRPSKLKALLACFSLLGW
mmetsp:Transcript_41061/g.121755  ORF Transcript_41061/g.121755 Transcript_41061/m.121755 type:complete len:336 (+) Transcript_41061:653-1660(+)